jgi:hypothetical protein
VPWISPSVGAGRVSRSFTGDGAYDQDHVYRSVINRDPDAEVIVPPRATAVLSERLKPRPHNATAISSALSKGEGCGGRKRRATTSAAGLRPPSGVKKQVIEDGLRFRKDGRRATEIFVAVHVLNQMQELGRPISVRIK